MNSEKVAYVILETECDDEGYIPCLVKEGETGYFKTDWNWGKNLELAKECADDKNKALGLSKQEVAKLILYSMFGK